MDTNKKKMIVVGIIFVAVIAIIFAITNIFQSDEIQTQSESSHYDFFRSSTTAPAATHARQDESFTQLSTTTTIPNRRSFNTQAAIDHLEELPVRGIVDINYPQLYLSPRYEAILNGEHHTGEHEHGAEMLGTIPIDQLNLAHHSDLDHATFNALRSTAIGVVQSEVTGQGREKYPTYFTFTPLIDGCIDFRAEAAGAISIPYERDNTWAQAHVVWKAKCYVYAKGKPPKEVSSRHTIYFHKSTGAWKPVTVTDIPGYK